MIIPLTLEAEPNSRPSAIVKKVCDGVSRQEVSIVTVLRSGTSVPFTDTKQSSPRRRAVFPQSVAVATPTGELARA
jgi:hypothetical protein